MTKKSATSDTGGVGNGASKGIISEAAEVAKTVSAEVRGGRLDRLALWITERVGTMMFFLVLFTWTVCWLLWNMFAPKAISFDPFPGFVLWLFISNMIQLFLMPLIMIGQNLQAKGAEQRAKNDYKVNLKAEKEIQEIREYLTTIVKQLEEMKRARS
jgi:uncharacterized membrane protein